MSEIRESVETPASSKSESEAAPPGTGASASGAAAAAHQGWSANRFTLISDMFPRRAVGSVVGIGGMAGAIGGMLISLLVGQILQASGSYVPIFVIAGLTYLVALLFIHLLVSKLEPANLDEPAV